MRPVIAAGATALLLSGRTLVRSEVTRFDQLPANPAGKSVYFVPLEEQEGSAAYYTFADQVSRELTKHGMWRANDIAEADYAVLMAYGIGGAHELSGAVPLYGQTGGGTTFHSGSVSAYGSGGSARGSYSGQSYTTPSYGIVGMMPYSRTEYDRFFTIRIVDLARSTEDHIVPVYEGNVASTGSSASFEQVGSCLIQALLQDFRGSSSERVTVPASDCP